VSVAQTHNSPFQSTPDILAISYIVSAYSRFFQLSNLDALSYCFQGDTGRLQGLSLRLEGKQFTMLTEPTPPL